MSSFTVDPPIPMPSKSIANFTIIGVSVNLFDSVIVSLRLTDQNGVELAFKSYKLTQEEYSQWGVDDNYLVNIIKQKIANEPI